LIVATRTNPDKLNTVVPECGVRARAIIAWTSDKFYTAAAPLQVAVRSTGNTNRDDARFIGRRDGTNPTEVAGSSPPARPWITHCRKICSARDTGAPDRCCYSFLGMLSIARQGVEKAHFATLGVNPALHFLELAQGSAGHHDFRARPRVGFSNRFPDALSRAGDNGHTSAMLSRVGDTPPWSSASALGGH
jgi:hypothetical protein